LHEPIVSDAQLDSKVLSTLEKKNFRAVLNDVKQICDSTVKRCNKVLGLVHIVALFRSAANVILKDDVGDSFVESHLAELNPETAKKLEKNIKQKDYRHIPVLYSH